MIPPPSPGAASQYRLGTTCIACGEPLRHPQSRTTAGDAVCASPHCRLVASRRGTMVPASFQRLVEVHRRHLREQQARTEAAARQRAERQATEAREAQAIRAAVGQDEDLPESRYPTVTVPTGLSTLEPVHPDRLAYYRSYVESIVAEAVAAPIGEGDGTQRPSTHDPAGPVPLAVQLCTRCAGGCCSAGGDRAYLKAATIRRVLRTQPELDPARLVDTYVGYVPAAAVAGACINQTTSGCSLPRELRSDICNDFHCTSLREWRSRYATGEPPLGAFVIQRDLDQWSQGAGGEPNPVTGVFVVTATETRRLRWPRD